MSPTAPFTRLRAITLCLLLALAAGCDPTPAKWAKAPPASPDAVALVQGQRLDKVFILAIARNATLSTLTPPLVSQALFACLERADRQDMTQSLARVLDARMGKEDIAGALAFQRTPHGQKFAELEWTIAVNGLVSGSALVAPEFTDEEGVAIDVYTASAQQTRFAAAGQAAAEATEHDSPAKAIIRQCEKAGK